MAAAFGVHLGSTSACLAVFKDGRTDVVANEAGDRVTPAVVAFTDHDQVVGPAAKHGLIRNAKNTVCNVKDVIGREYSDPVIERYKEESQVKVIEKKGFPSFSVVYKEENCQFSPRHVALLIYKHLRETAARHGEGDIHDAVLAVPTDFTEQQKMHLRRGPVIVQIIAKTVMSPTCGQNVPHIARFKRKTIGIRQNSHVVRREAATRAGFSILRIISEPAAATLAYNVGQDDPHQHCRVLVYRLGGTGLDVSIVNVNSGMYTLRASVNESVVNGNAFTQLLAQHLATEFKRTSRQDMMGNPRSVCKLKGAAEHCKHILTRVQTAQSFIESLYEGIDYNCQITRARFEGLCSGLVQKCMLPISKALLEAELGTADIDKVILCGGGSKMPCLQQAIKDYFPAAEILNTIEPDEVIAIGAANQAAILTGSDEESGLIEQCTELPCLDKSIVAQVNCGEELKLIFARWTPIPCRRQLVLPVVNEEFAMIVGEAPSTGEVQIENTLAQINLSDLPNDEQVTAVFHFRSDGSLHITCSEKTSDKSFSAVIEAS